MQGDRQGRGIRRASIACQPLSPRETPMGALGSGEDCRRGWDQYSCWSSGTQANSFAANDLEPSSSKMATRPVFPEHWSKRECLRRLWPRRRGIRVDGMEGPKDRTHPRRFDAGPAFLTLSSQGTGATMADASGIQDPKRAIALRSVLLWVEGMISRAAQRPICLQGKSGTGKATGTGRMGPLRRTILNLRRGCASRDRLDGRS